MTRSVHIFASFEEQDAEAYRYWQTLPIPDRMHANWSLSHRDGSTVSAIPALFAKHNVRYLIVGGYAYSIYARARFTADIDLFISRDPENVQRVFRALIDFGAPLQNVDATYFTQPDSVFQIGIEPDRIDILTGISGVTFEEAWATRVIDGHYTFISRDLLIANKTAAARDQDLVDVKNLQRYRPPA